jgi:putative endonuclease
VLWLAAEGGDWAGVRIDVIGVRFGRRRTPQVTHVKGVS